MKKFLFLAVLFVAHCYPNIEPSHAHARPLNCKTTCRTDSGGHSICRTSCW